MFSKAYSGIVLGIDGALINVEADVSDGLPMFSMVGFLSSEVKEAKDRVRIALKNAGFALMPKKITINLSPADLRKEGTAYDLPIAIAILSAYGYLPGEKLKDTLILGEVSLNGKIEKVNGVLPIVSMAKKVGMKRCIVPIGNAKEGAVVEGIEVIGVNKIKEVVDYLTNRQWIEPTYVDINQIFSRRKRGKEYDFSEVIGQNAVKRALEIAVAGMHNVLLIGPPGSGKSMLAKRIPSIMPDLTFEESINITKIYSISGLLEEGQALINTRPFRAPHHTITEAALVGGGRQPKPGEISLATGGVLFLDELPEFRKSTLELMRQPLEDRTVTLARVNGTYRYPTNFMLVAAMNPCQCGYFPDMNLCTCTPASIKRYLSKISGPLLDRIDLVIEAIQIDYKTLQKVENQEDSKTIRARVMKAREVQLKRYQRDTIHFNGEMTPKDINKYCGLEQAESRLMEQVFDKMRLSARAYHRILKVARTIADLEQEENIQREHLSEAICYRSLDQKYWGE